MTVRGTPRDDFIHQAGDGHSPPPGYFEITGLTGGEDTVLALAGSDLIYMGSTLDSGDSIDGGPDGDGETDTDTVEIFGDYISHTVQGHTISDALSLGPSTLQNISDLVLDGGTSHLTGFQIGYDITLNAQAPSPNDLFFTVDGSALSGTNAMIIDGSAAAYAIEMRAGDGPNTLTGGAGNDVFYLKSTANLVNSSIDGGAGFNIVDIQHADGATTHLSGLENIQTIDFDVVSGDANLVAGDSLTPAGKSLIISALGTHSFSFDGHAETDGSFNITGSNGDDTIIAGAQADRIDAGTGNNSISGNGGDDFISVSVAQNTIDRIDGGTGNDTVRLLSSGSTPQAVIFDDAALQNVENLQFTFVGSLTMADGNVAVGHVLQVSFNAASTASPNSFDGTAETDGAYNFDLTNLILLSASGGWSVIGGAGNDIFRLSDIDHPGTANSWEGGGGLNTLDYSHEAQGLALDARTGTATGPGAVSDHFSNFTAFKFGSGANTFFGSGASETVYMLSGGNESAKGFSGNDHFFFGATLAALDVVDGGDGNDVLTLDGDYSAGLTFNATTVTNVETIALTGGHAYSLTTNNATVAAGGHLTVNASALAAGDSFKFNGAAETDGIFTVLAGAGANTFTGGAGADVVYFKTADFNASDHVDGGAGSAIDGLSFTTNGYITAAALAGISHIERIFLSAGVSHNLTLPDSLVASADDSHLLTIVGNSGHDTINASAVLAGDSVRFEGGGAADRFIAGGGADIFYYFAPSDSTGDANGTLYDTVIHFNPAADRFDLPTGFSVASVATVSSGSLSGGGGTFDSDMEAAIGSALHSHGAVDFHVTAGNLSGHEFLVVNPITSNGYVSGADYVFDVTGHYAGAFTTGNFI